MLRLWNRCRIPCHLIKLNLKLIKCIHEVVDILILSIVFLGRTMMRFRTYRSYILTRFSPIRTIWAYPRCLENPADHRSIIYHDNVILPYTELPYDPVTRIYNECSVNLDSTTLHLEHLGSSIINFILMKNDITASIIEMIESAECIPAVRYDVAVRFLAIWVTYLMPCLHILVIVIHIGFSKSTIRMRSVWIRILTLVIQTNRVSYYRLCYFRNYRTNLCILICKLNMSYTKNHRFRSMCEFINRRYHRCTEVCDDRIITDIMRINQ